MVAILVDTKCAQCSISFGIPDWYERAKRANGTRFYCPAGHHLYFSKGESVEQRLRAELNASQDRLARNEAYTRRVRDERDAIDRSRTAIRGQLTKVKNRIAKGVCPCCHRSFEASILLAQHIEQKHPEFIQGEKHETSS